MMAVDVHSYGNEWIYPYAADGTDTKLKKRDNYPLYSAVVSKLKENNRTIMSCWESLRYIADGVVILVLSSILIGLQIRALSLWLTKSDVISMLIQTSISKSRKH